MASSIASIPKVEGAFWTVRQRQMHSLHYAVSYRASFKPELPDYLIRKYSKSGQLVGDPFCGRGTTILQANLLGRYAIANDINPLAVYITRAKVNPVSLTEIQTVLDGIDWTCQDEEQQTKDLLPFYHPRTLQEILALKKGLVSAESDAARFISMLAISRLHGHSTGFFSAYSMPQLSVTPQAQQRINRQRGQTPQYRPVRPRLLAKAKSALRDNQVAALRKISSHNLYTNSDACRLVGWPTRRLDLIITSPPFLNKVDYLMDNWLEHWFLGIDVDTFKASMMQTASLVNWQLFMQGFFCESARVLKPGGLCIIEVGEVLYKKKSVNLDDVLLEVLAMNPDIGLKPVEILIHRQKFSKLSHCFAVTNNVKGTNTQRMLVLQKNSCL